MYQIYAREVYFWDNEQSLELMHTERTYPPRFTLEVHGENATHNEVALVEFEGAYQDLSTQIYLSLPATGTKFAFFQLSYNNLILSRYHVYPSFLLVKLF